MTTKPGHEIPDGGRRFREAVERAMREDDPEVTDEAIAQALRGIRPAIVYSRVRDRSDGGRRTITRDGGAVPLTPDGLARLARLLPGGANRGGRTDERSDRLDEYRIAILALVDKGYVPGRITARLVLEHIHRTGSEAQLRKDMSDPDIGGWIAFRSEAIRSR